MAKTLYVSRTQAHHAMAVARASSAFPVRDEAILCIGYGTGMKLYELATLPVSAYLKPNGEIRIDSEIPAEIAYNGIARPVCWTNKRVTDAIDKYLDFRQKHNHSTTTKKSAYRGLDPSSPIICTDEGVAYKLTGRKTKGGATSYSPDSLSQRIKELHEKAGIEGANAESMRRSFAINLHREGYDLRYLSEALGLRTLSAVRALVGQDPVRLGAIVKGVI